MLELFCSFRRVPASVDSDFLELTITGPAKGRVQVCASVPAQVGCPQPSGPTSLEIPEWTARTNLHLKLKESL